MGTAHLYMDQSRYEDVLKVCNALDEFYETLPPQENNRFGHLRLKAEALVKLGRNSEAVAALEAAKKTPLGEHDDSIGRRIQQILSSETESNGASETSPAPLDASSAASATEDSCCGSAKSVAAGARGGRSCSAGIQPAKVGSESASVVACGAPPTSIAATTAHGCTCGAKETAAGAGGPIENSRLR
jgi:hypothetical protein